MTENRRLSDKILAAFDLAHAQDNTAVAELLMRALELALTQEGGPGRIDAREELGPVIDAYSRLRTLQGAVQHMIR